jgi:hypothetical protein
MATVSPRCAAACAVALAASTLAAPARADEPAEWETAPATRRGGFVVGTALGFGVASLVGYPNDVKKAGYLPYYHVTNVRPAPVIQVWLGGALADWLNFGVGVSSTFVLATGENQARSFAGLFHLEAYPLFYVSDKLRDLGIMLDVGAGAASLTTPSGEKLVDSSAASLVGGGVFWERLSFWRFRGGPFLLGNYMWSDTARRPALFAGFRLSLYSAAPRP